MSGEKLKHLLLSIAMHPAALAVPVALLFILLLPDYFDKYKLNLKYERIISGGGNIAYHDLNHDGKSEKFLIGPNSKGESQVTLHNGLGAYFQWNFRGHILKDRDYFTFGDTDNDTIDDLLVFTKSGDTLLLSRIDYTETSSVYLDSRSMFVFDSTTADSDFSFSTLAVTDINGDGFKELIYFISNGFNYLPRRIFAYDLKNDSLITSPELGGHFGPVDIRDIDNDGLPEFAVSNYGSGNINNDSLPMQDTCAYLIVLDNNLQFLFPPIPSIGRYNGMQNKFIKDGDSNYIVSFWNKEGVTPGELMLGVYDRRGKVLNQKFFPPEFRNEKSMLSVFKNEKGKERILLKPRFTKLMAFDSKLNEVKGSDIKTGENGLFQFDFDNDGKQELLFQSIKPEQWVILRNNLRFPVHFEASGTQLTPRIYTISNAAKKQQISILMLNREYVFEYEPNRLYFWKYLIYAGIYAAVLLFILLLRRVLNFQLQKRYETEKRIAELQYISLHNQISPHFTFNVFNTIGSAIMTEKKDEAYLLLVRFSKLLRSLLNNPDHVTRTLREELDFVTNFLDIQQHRFAEQFVYTIDVDPELDTERLLPRACIQTYAENAVKHGLIPLPGSGKLEIKAVHESDHMKLIIRDNGVGRKAASESGKVTTRIGLKVMHQYYELLNKSNSKSITETITDLHKTNGEASGTEVEICIPDEFEFEFYKGGKHKLSKSLFSLSS